MFCTGQNVCAFYPEFPHSKIVCECSALDRTCLDRTCVLFTLNFHIPRLSVQVFHWTERVCFLPRISTFQDCLCMFCTGQNVCACYPEFPHSKIVCAGSALNRKCVLV